MVAVSSIICSSLKCRRSAVNIASGTSTGVAVIATA